MNIWIILSLVVPSLCILGVDLCDQQFTPTYQCIKNQGYQFAVLRAYCSQRGLQDGIANNIRYAKSVGLQTNIYISPCIGKSASAQIDEIVGAFSAKLYDTIWIHLQINRYSGCEWTNLCTWRNNFKSNCDFLLEMIKRIKTHKKVPGIFTSHDEWIQIMGSTNQCSEAGSQLLWFVSHDGNPSLDGFSPFGGWTKPVMKQYQSTDGGVCKVGAAKNYRP